MCHDDDTVVVKGLAEVIVALKAAFEISTDSTIVGLRKHLVPTTNTAYDIGSAEFKVRHFYLSDAWRDGFFFW